MFLQKFTLTLLLFIFSFNTLAEFVLGQDNGKSGVVVTDESSQFKLKLGTRLQTSASVIENNISNKNEAIQNNDFYIRRGRFQVDAKFNKYFRFYMDIRNDNSNQGDSGEGDFNIGDAFVESNNLFGINGLKLRAFRAKVDVSRSQTISSSKLLYLDRSYITDEAAQFVNHNRRASNIQLLGTFDKWYFQLVVGDGVESSKFNDAFGNNLASGEITSQSFMSGMKVKFYPFSGWEDKKMKESYLGRGKHFSFGIGGFQTHDINFINKNDDVGKVDRELITYELSFHMNNFSFQSEYFHFNGVVKDLSSSSFELGQSDGYYVHAEYVLENQKFLAPFIRYESWNRFKGETGFDLTSKVYGINWYLQGNKMRIAVAVQLDSYGKNILESDALNNNFDQVNMLKVTSMWHY